MGGAGVGTVLFTLIGGLVMFLIGAAITRAIFSINKIVRLLEVTAQELRARNMADGIYGKLVYNKETVSDLNQLSPAQYEEEDTGTRLGKG